MIGPRQKLEAKLFYTSVNLDERIPPKHRLRRLRETLDLEFVRPAVADCYGFNGQESIDPIVLMKLMLLLFLENVSSERALVEQLAFRLDWLWFCEMDPDDPIPNHSVLSKARRRWGVEVFTTLFGRVLQQCVDAGLVSGDVLHVDGSCVAGNVDVAKLQPVLRLRGKTLYEQLEAECEPVHPSGRFTGRSDREAGVTRKNGQTICGYKDHRAVDDAEGVITATVTTDAAADEGHLLADVLAEHEHNTGGKPDTVVADTQYGTAANYERLHRDGVTPCIPAKDGNAPRKGKFGHDAFQYMPAKDCFVCPAGQDLYPYDRDDSHQRTRYRAAGGVCRTCPLRSRCTDSRDGRRVQRHMAQEHIDWANSCLSKARRRHLRRRRDIRMEGSFADGANQHGFKRARWRGLAKMTIQNLLIAVCQNLRKLLKAGRRFRSMAAVSRQVTQTASSALWALFGWRKGATRRPAVATTLKPEF
jgi:IS5 family transposase